MEKQIYVYYILENEESQGVSLRQESFLEAEGLYRAIKKTMKIENKKVIYIDLTVDGKVISSHSV